MYKMMRGDKKLWAESFIIRKMYNFAQHIIIRLWQKNNQQHESGNGQASRSRGAIR